MAPKLMNVSRCQTSIKIIEKAFINYNYAVCKIGSLFVAIGRLH